MSEGPHQVSLGPECFPICPSDPRFERRKIDELIAEVPPSPAASPHLPFSPAVSAPYRPGLSGNGHNSRTRDLQSFQAPLRPVAGSAGVRVLPRG